MAPKKFNSAPPSYRIATDCAASPRATYARASDPRHTFPTKVATPSARAPKSAASGIAYMRTNCLPSIPTRADGGPRIWGLAIPRCRGLRLSCTRHTYYQTPCRCDHQTRATPYRAPADEGYCKLRRHPMLQHTVEQRPLGGDAAMALSGVPRSARCRCHWAWSAK
jgi:hypothetical protein